MSKAVLRNLKIKRVAVVDLGANLDKSTGDGSHIMLFKSAGPSVGDVHVDRPLGSDGKKKDDAGHLAAQGRVGLANIPADVAARRKTASNRKPKEKSVKKNWLTKMLGIAAEPDATKRAELVAKAAEDDEDEDDDVVHKASCDCAKCMDKNKATSKSAEDIEKRMADAVSKAVTEAVTKATTDIQKRLDGEVERRELGEVREILKSFSATPFDLAEDKDVKVYLALKRANPESFDTVIKSMRAQDAIIAKSAAFTDIGTRKGTGEGSAWGQIEAKADQLISKATEKMTREEAIVAAMEQNPSLVKLHRQESV